MDLQDQLLSNLETRVVAPLYEKTATVIAIRGLNPELDLDGKTYLVSLSEVAAVHRQELGAVVASLADRRPELIAGVDLVFTGI